MAKDHTGKIVPYYPPKTEVRFVDGSLQADIPRERLAVLYNVNQFFVSQVNPHVVPFLPQEAVKRKGASLLGRW